MKSLMTYLNHIKQYFIVPEVKEQNPVLKKNLSRIENRIKGIIQFLKKTHVSMKDQSVKLNDLPWFLLIGPVGSGKTTFLAHSGMKYILNKKIKPEQLNRMPSSENCDWWVTHHTVLIDVPGNYIENKKKLIRQMWRHFLSQVYHQRGNQGICGIVLTLSLPDLMDKNRREIDAVQIRSALSDLNNYFGDLPIYCSITKCDTIPGFQEFFSEYGRDELTQVFGVSIPPSSDLSLSDVVNKRFHALIKRLNEQLISRLHQEQNPYAKIHIKDFPLQIEHVKEAFLEFLKLWSKERDPKLRGIYLNSAIQNTEEKQAGPPQIVLASTYENALSILKAPIMPGQPYFIKQFLLQALAPMNPASDILKSSEHSSWLNAAIFTVAALLALFSLLYLGDYSIYREPHTNSSTSVALSDLKSDKNF